MTYTLSATKKQDGQAKVQTTFSYEETIFFGDSLTVPDNEWQAHTQQVLKQRKVRQGEVAKTIIQFLEQKYNAQGIKKLDQGRDIYAGEVDVIVCDGFVGNVALKVSEGIVDMVKQLLRDSLEASITGKIGYALAKTAFTAFRKRLDYSEYGGVPLLGVDGRCIISHGSSDPKAIKNAIRVAAEFKTQDINTHIVEELESY